MQWFKSSWKIKYLNGVHECYILITLQNIYLNGISNLIFKWYLEMNN